VKKEFIFTGGEKNLSPVMVILAIIVNNLFNKILPFSSNFCFLVYP
jgi:hypothetical protein